MTLNDILSLISPALAIATFFIGRATASKADGNRMIQQDGTGAVYSEAYDPADSGRTYTETEEEIATEAEPYRHQSSVG